MSSSVPLASVLSSVGDPQLLLHLPGDPSIPLPLRPGDYNVDGFPDLLLTISNSTAAPGGGLLSGSSSRKAGHQARVLENVPCAKGLPGCEGKKDRRTFAVGQGAGWEALDEIWDASGASWLDVDDDVSPLSISAKANGGLADLMARARSTSWSSALAHKVPTVSLSSRTTSTKTPSSSRLWVSSRCRIGRSGIADLDSLKRSV